MLPNHYATLGVAPDSDDVVIRAAFKAMMLKYHPDTNKSADATKRAAAINAAFSVIGDPQKRAAYDAARKPGKSAPPAPPSPPTPPSPPPPAPPRGASPQSQPPTGKQPSPVEKDRWTKVAGCVAGVIAVGLIRVAIQTALHSSPSPTAVPSMENSTVVDMNSTEGVDMMSDNMTAAAGLLGGGMMANGADVMSPPASKLAEPTPVDFSDVEEAAQTFAKTLDSGGMMGARAWSEKCHKNVDAAPTWAAADRCAAFDYAAHYLDVGYSQASGGQPIGYFTYQADNQADQYVRAGAPTYVLPPRLSQIEKAVGPATSDAVYAMMARRKARDAAKERDIDEAVRFVGPSNNVSQPDISSGP